MLTAAALWTEWHTTWQEQVFIGILLGIAVGFYYASNPNLLMDAVPPPTARESAPACSRSSAPSAHRLARRSSPPSWPRTPSTVAVNPLTHKTTVSSIPGIYSHAGYSLSYVVIGVIPAALTLLIAIVLRAGRTPARGGASEASLLTEAEASGVAGAM